MPKRELKRPHQVENWLQERKRQSTAALQDAAALFKGPQEFRQVLECGCALPLSFDVPTK